MVWISNKVGVIDEIWNLNFNKYPMPSFYNDYPFLIYENILDKKECELIINSLNKKEDFKANLIHKGLDENIRKTILHKPTPFIIQKFEKIFYEKKEDIERFFNVSIIGGSEIQILEYKEGGHYNCHVDNASVLIKDNKIVGFKEVANRQITTLLFLNEDFEGGELEFCYLRDKSNNKVILKPKVGEMIVFASHGVFSHKVYPVKKGKRFAIVKWHNTIKGYK